MCCSVFTAKFVYGCCLVKAQGFRPGGVHSHFLPHNLYSSAGQLSTPAIIKHDETCFPGHSEFQPKLSLFSPPTISLFVFETKHQKMSSVTGQ